jgi:hypothetical protein
VDYRIKKEGFEMSEIKIVRLQSGEVVMGKVVEGDSEITVADPAILLPAGDNRIGLAPFMPYAAFSELTLKNHHIMFIVDPIEEFKNQYTQAVSGLTIPSAAESAAINADGLKLTTD